MPARGFLFLAERLQLDFSERKEELKELNQLVEKEKEHNLKMTELIQKQADIQNELTKIHFKVTELTKTLDVEVPLNNIDFGEF